MRSQLPSLYRSMEKSGTANGYDAIAMAATLNFLSIATPSAAQAGALTRLIEPLWRHLGADTRAEIAGRLAHHPSVPAGISSLIARGIEEETATGPSAAAHEDTDEPGAISMSDMALLASAETTGEAPKLTASSAAEARHTLRNLLATPARPAKTKSAVIQIARSRDRIALRDYLASNLALDIAAAEALLDPDNLPELSGALKALGLTTPDAMTVLMFVDEAISTNIATFAIAKNHYEQLAPSAAAHRFGKPESPAPITPRLQPASADLPSPVRSTGPRRQAFGRRGDNQNRQNGTRS
ncbi:hypothetical protein U0C82_04790 [Fulvimarina sp. 2208YS6-2-32]|uniref:DUF2336 domain-containing protein n=1 Tax=Fulvimarina uroteuthidis TaxID=3098149 RepID=A0ABU5HZB3_9HYPH|nr:hypothetical protein [Fulvimarina sp. 2208YS6-2-32]MDY8108469.1 hypothetical protein [Fulvimarina sp. 2208YS6-2-32]